MTYLADKPDWDVIGLSRRAPDFQTATRFLQLNLTDATACREALRDLTNITHVFYCAYVPRATFAEEVEPNLAMSQNLISELEPVTSNLSDVQLVHGRKWYGCHLGPYKTPTRNDDPRPTSPCLYFDQ